MTTPRALRVVPPVSPPCDADAPALAGVANGDVGALGEVYDRHAQALFRFATRTVGTNDAHDVMQSTFLRAAKVAHTYESRGADARPWLFGIAVRIIQERNRALFRLGRALKRLGESDRAMDADPTTRTDLQRGLLTLSEVKRVTLVLAEVEGFSGEEIAQMLDVPVGTVWRRLHQARKELRLFCEGES